MGGDKGRRVGGRDSVLDCGGGAAALEGGTTLRTVQAHGGALANERLQSDGRFAAHRQKRWLATALQDAKRLRWRVGVATALRLPGAKRLRRRVGGRDSVLECGGGASAQLPLWKAEDLSAPSMLLKIGRAHV